jgi:Uma2 family endonuclease
MASVPRMGRGLMATATALALHKVSYEVYVGLRDDPRNDDLLMTYFDGTLEIMSPATKHQRPSRRLGIVIYEIVTSLGIDCDGLGSTTFRKRGKTPEMGKGKESDECFYLANEHRILGKATIDLDQGDPPPDLWIEVDKRASTKGRLPVYASLSVPEVCRYNARKKTIWIGRLNDTGTYDELDRSVALPMLARSLVLKACPWEIPGRNRSIIVWSGTG